MIMRTMTVIDCNIWFLMMMNDSDNDAAGGDDDHDGDSN